MRRGGSGVGGMKENRVKQTMYELVGSQTGRYVGR
jgi:hypothetical protein